MSAAGKCRSSMKDAAGTRWVGTGGTNDRGSASFRLLQSKSQKRAFNKHDRSVRLELETYSSVVDGSRAQSGRFDGYDATMASLQRLLQCLFTEEKDVQAIQTYSRFVPDDTLMLGVKKIRASDSAKCEVSSVLLCGTKAALSERNDVADISLGIAAACLSSLPAQVSIGFRDEVVSVVCGLLAREECTLHQQSMLFGCLASKPGLGGKLPWGAEKVVDLVVRQSVLRFVGSLETSDISYAEKANYCCPAMTCLQILMNPSSDHEPQTNQPRLSKHAWAILAPLVLDVLPSGLERRRTNPLRQLTLDAVCSFWKWSYESTTPVEQSGCLILSCECFISVLAAIHSLKRDEIGGNTSEMDVRTVARHLRDLIAARGNGTARFLDMFSHLCSAYPNASSSQWQCFLEGYGAAPPLLQSLLEDGTIAYTDNIEHSEHLCLLPSILVSVKSLTKAIPFTIWLASDQSPLKMTHGNFSARLRQATMHLVSCINRLVSAMLGHLFLVQPDIWRHTSQLALQLCECLPFDENSLFLEPISRMVKTFGDVYVKSCTNQAEIHSISGNTIVGILSSKSGTRIFPSLGFVQFLLDNGEIVVLSAVVKAHPVILTRDSSLITSFCQLCRDLSLGCRQDSRKLSAVLINSYTQGRKRFRMRADILDDVTISLFSDTLYPILQALLIDGCLEVQLEAVSVFESLLWDDWQILLRDSWDPLCLILNKCHDGNDARVIISSCKTVGEVCTVCLSQNGREDDFIVTFNELVCGSMHDALTSENQSVRSMALFAVGNLSLASPVAPYRSRSCRPIRGLFPVVFLCLDDKSDKVLANAIRTIGHISRHIYGNEQCSANDPSGSACQLQRLIRILTSKVKSSLSCAGLSWKRRKGIQKLAWGGANALGELLGFDIILRLNVEVVSAAIASLLECIDHSPSINEKVTSASVQALVKLPTAVWRHLSRKCDTVANGLATCFSYLHNSTSTRHQRDMEVITNTLLMASRKEDFTHLFGPNDSAFPALFMYNWIVKFDVSSAVLQEIAASVGDKQSDHVIDVSVAQMFLSRAEQSRLRSGSVDRHLPSFDEADEEEDEL